MKEFNNDYRNIIQSIFSDGDYMYVEMPYIGLKMKENKDKKEFYRYKEEIYLHLLHINLKREVGLSFILFAIIIFLLCLEVISTNGWSRNIHIYSHFSYIHIFLMLIPLVFLLLLHSIRQASKLNIKLCRILHFSINFFVLSACSLISVYNSINDKLPYSYIVAMFCIASIVLLEIKERLVIYIFSYFIYIFGSIIIGDNFYHLIGNIFFFTLFVILALTVSHIQYTSYLRNFINRKIILSKNSELNKLYRVSEEVLKQRTNQLNETMDYEKLRVAFFANISHELRTPLTVIYSAEQMLDLFFKRDEFETKKKETKEYMEIIKQNCYRLIRLVANLIDITKIDAGYFNVTFQNCDIIKVVEDITLSVAKFIEDRNINLIFDTEIEEITVACDPEKIERIILNLLSNAVKFTPKGGAIYVNIYEKEDVIEIHIKDTGMGIPKSMNKSIFDRFIQVDKTISRNHEGSGIGLSIVKSLVDMHNGTISLISDEGKGSEFIIELPKITISSVEDRRGNNLDYEKQNVEKINIEFSDIYQ